MYVYMYICKWGYKIVLRYLKLKLKFFLCNVFVFFLLYGDVKVVLSFNLLLIFVYIFEKNIGYFWK